VDVLGEKPFHLRGRLNYGVLDSVVTTLMHSDKIPTRAAFSALFEDKDFIKSVTINTSDRSEVETRISLSKQYLG